MSDTSCRIACSDALRNCLQRCSAELSAARHCGIVCSDALRNCLQWTRASRILMSLVYQQLVDCPKQNSPCKVVKLYTIRTQRGQRPAARSSSTEVVKKRISPHPWVCLVRAWAHQSGSSRGAVSCERILACRQLPVPGTRTPFAAGSVPVSTNNAKLVEALARGAEKGHSDIRIELGAPFRPKAWPERR